MILNHEIHGTGPPVLLVHGMAGSLGYWKSSIAQLSSSYTVIAIDLLGFGHSPESQTDYSADVQSRSIKDTLDYLKVDQPLIMVGHSMGALIALRYALMYPKIISQLILLNTPIYQNKAQAIKDITQGKKYLQYAYYGLGSRVLCTTWCYYMRPFSQMIAPLYLRSKPKHIARDSVLHTWKSYSQSMQYVIEDQDVQLDIDRLMVPTTMIFGTKESKVVLANARSLQKNENIRFVILDGSHNLPLEKPDIIAMYTI